MSVAFRREWIAPKSSSGGTRALAAGYRVLSRLNDRAAVNAVVLFTDNVPEGLYAA